MVINYNWVISTMDCTVSKNGMSNVIERIHWRYMGINENGTTAEAYGSQLLGDPNPSEFIDYQNLTENIVTNWLEENIDVNNLRQEIEDRINAIENPQNVTLPPPFN